MALGLLKERFSHDGIAAMFVPEAATDLILSGIAPWTCPSMLAFQTQVIALQLEREAAAIAEASEIASDTLIVFDRGICDSHAYLSDEDYMRALSENNLVEPRMLERYDAVFHLESIAKTDPGAYTKANNPARFETAEEAVIADARVLAAWSCHPHVAVIEGERTFELKFDHLLHAVKGRMPPASELSH